MSEKEVADGVVLPIEVFQDRAVSVLEAIAEYLRDSNQLSFREIAVLLNRDERTVWTVYSRAKKKRAVREAQVVRVCP